MWVSFGLAFLGGLAMPIGSVLMWLFIPAITTTYDSARGLVLMEYRRPLARSIKEYRLADIANVGLVSMGEDSYSLALILKSGRKVRIAYSSTSNTRELEEQAARIWAAIGAGPRNIVV